MGRFIVDLICPEARLVIEVDGPIHSGQAAAKADAERDLWLEEREIFVLRVSNDEVVNDMSGVLKRIYAVAESRTVHSD